MTEALDKPTSPEANSGTEEHDAAVDNAEMSFLEHLLELRSRILRSLLAVVVLFVPIYAFDAEVYRFVAEPLNNALPEGSSMIATGVAAVFVTPFKLSIYCAIYLAMPFILHQVWAFVAPGLYLREKKFALPLLISSIVLFYAGIAFVYYLVFPLVFGFFAGIGPDIAPMMPDISQYLDFALKLFLAFGLAFEIPIATILIAWTGISDAESMAKKRPYVVLGCFVVGMLLTPPDVISQILLAIPCWLLFELGVFGARFIEKREAQ